jgi:hypothetical protein
VGGKEDATRFLGIYLPNQKKKAVADTGLEKENVNRKFILIDGTNYLDRSSCKLISQTSEEFVCQCGDKKKTARAWRNHLAKKSRQTRRKIKLNQLQTNLQAESITKTVLNEKHLSNDKHFS